MLFLREKVVEVWVNNGRTTLYDVVRLVLASPDVLELKNKMLKYHPEGYRPSVIYPPLSLSAFTNANDQDAVLAQFTIEWEYRLSPVMCTLAWPLD